MKTSLLRIVIASVCFLAALPSHASVLNFSANLSGLNEIPANASPADGSAIFELDTSAHTLRLQIQFSGLLGTTTAAHIHCCGPTTANAGVATSVPTFPGFPLGISAGSYDYTLDLTLASSFNPAFVAANGGISGAENFLTSGMLAGESYLNIHTNAFPAGEIRGTLIPEPGTTALLALGLSLATVVRRRRPVGQAN